VHRLDIVTGPGAKWSENDRQTILDEYVARIAHVREIGYLERDVVHANSARLKEVRGMMIGIAAQE
jgi:sigma54-dependent transcription regulator